MKEGRCGSSYLILGGGRPVGEPLGVRDVRLEPVGAECAEGDTSRAEGGSDPPEDGGGHGVLRLRVGVGGGSEGGIDLGEERTRLVVGGHRGNRLWLRVSGTRFFSLWCRLWWLIVCSVEKGSIEGRDGSSGYRRVCQSWVGASGHSMAETLTGQELPCAFWGARVHVTCSSCQQLTAEVVSCPVASPSLGV